MFIYIHHPDDENGLCHHFRDPSSLRIRRGNRERRAEIMDWCTAEFGYENPHKRWYILGWTVRIRDHTDAMAFRLRWC